MAEDGDDGNEDALPEEMPQEVGPPARSRSFDALFFLGVGVALLLFVLYVFVIKP